MDATVIIPAYNEETRIARTLADLLRHFGRSVRFLVVVNGSTDRTADVVDRLVRHHADVLSSIVIPEKVGKGGAVQAGFRRVTTPIVAYADADGATPPQDLARLLRAVAEVDVAIGSRYARGAHVRRSFLRRIAGGAFRLAVRVLLHLPFADTQCGYKAFRTGWIQRVLPQLKVSDLAFDVELLAFLQRAGARIREVPVTWQEIPGPAAGWQRQLGRTGLTMLRTLWLLRRRLESTPPIP